MTASEFIREAQPEDFNEIFLLLGQLWEGMKLDREKLKLIFEFSINDKNEFAFCYIKEGSIIGFASGNIQNAYYRAGRLCYLAIMVVDSVYQKCGIGIKLMDFVKEYAIMQNCNAIELTSGVKREQTHNFYEKYGFARTAFCFALEL